MILKSIFTAGETQSQIIGYEADPQRSRGGSWTKRVWDVASPALLGGKSYLRTAVSTGMIDGLDLPMFSQPSPVF